MRPPCQVTYRDTRRASAGMLSCLDKLLFALLAVLSYRHGVPRLVLRGRGLLKVKGALRIPWNVHNPCVVCYVE